MKLIRFILRVMTVLIIFPILWVCTMAMETHDLLERCKEWAKEDK